MRRILLISCLCLAATSSYAKGGWMTDDTTQCQVWDSDPNPQQSITWSGQCENGKASGEGTAKWYVNNQLAVTLKGVMKGGLCQNECFMSINTGSKEAQYIGQMKNNERHGKGSFTWPNGDKYTGDWSQGKKHGKGGFTWSNGSTYIGDWKDDMSNGKGTYIWVQRDEKKYIGEVKDDKFNGYGIMIYTTDDKYSGSWANGKKHGKGIYTFNDGTSYKGIWEFDVRIQMFPKWRDYFFW